MIRCLGVLLILALLLCGCAQNTTQPAPTDSVPNTGISGSTGLYIPGSAIESATNGAIREFRLEDGEYYGCVALGKDLVLMNQVETNGSFTLYHGEQLEKVSSLALGQGVVPDLSQIHSGDQGISYYDSKNNAVVFLNQHFVETGRMYLPEGLLGNVWPAPNWSAIYYCTAQGIHAMDLQTGISRLILEQTAFHQEITGILGNGEVLRYDVEIIEGQRKTILIEASSGVALQEGDYLSEVQTRDQQYFLPQSIKGVRHLRFGTAQNHQVLWPMEEDSRPVVLFANNAVIMAAENAQQTTLIYYDLETGMRVSAITLEGICEVTNLQGDGENGVWMFAREGENMHLYHWNTEKTPTADTTVYTEPLYTVEEPNAEELSEITKEAVELGKKFGIDILAWKDAVAKVPENQTMTEEFRTQIYAHYLPRLKAALSVFPEGFFTKNSKEKLQIALVGKIEGNPEKGTLSETEYLQFWDHKTPVLAITCTENFEFNLYHGLFLYMETRIMSQSSAIYEWFRLNPSGFTYDNDYIKNLERTDTTYVDGEKPYFADLFSMSFAKEDRARIFAYACTEGNAEVFKNSVLQEKLRRICKGIREAYGLKKVETPFLWEQFKT